MFRDDPYKVFPNFEHWNAELTSVGDAGYCMMLHMSHWRTAFSYGTHRSDWLNVYAANNFILLDPIMLWAMTNTGVRRWSDISFHGHPQHAFIMDRAREFDLNYGAVAVTKSAYLENKRCMVCVARTDREINDQELGRLSATLREIVDDHDERMGLSDADVATIQKLAEGMSQDIIAHEMNVTRDAVKKRIERIRKRLGAKNTTHIVSMALSNCLIEAVR
ncbi:autoinducer binding domain-containing protein [Epibacterium sp. DP7N7-1]|nr:autoinducer binding domain-containing protein [Epibacterium sp. DP7N7-1]